MATIIDKCSITQAADEFNVCRNSIRSWIVKKYVVGLASTARGSGEFSWVCKKSLSNFLKNEHGKISPNPTEHSEHFKRLTKKGYKTGRKKTFVPQEYIDDGYDILSRAAEKTGLSKSWLSRLVGAGVISTKMYGDEKLLKLFDIYNHKYRKRKQKNTNK